MRYFLGSSIFTFFALLSACLWAHKMHPGAEFKALFAVLILSILEISLSFDNAVVNASKLEKMSHLWQQRFLSWGIIIAVFGMRFLFPILVVAIFSGLSLIDVAIMAINDADKYTYYLHSAHPPIITFGGAFLIMLFLNYFFNEKKEVHWIGFIEKKLVKLAGIKGLNVIITLLLLYFQQNFIADNKLEVLTAGIWGIIIYLLIEGISSALENKNEGDSSNCTKHFSLSNSCFVNFLYLELIDASFSLDGVLGAFALSKDILIITIGLSIGAMFVRSLTIMLVEKKTLKEFIYLEHGAHYAIGALGIIMLISAFFEISEIITGLIGVVFILAAFVCSLKKA